MISMIAAIGKNRELGKDGGLIWNLPGDLRFFKETTMGHPILMGARTWESLPGKLPGREHYVLTRHPESLPDGVHAVTDIDKLVEEWQNSPNELFVIGGGMVYWQMLKHANKLYLTEVEAEDGTADTFFPEFDKAQWKRQVIRKGQDHGVAYTHVLYTKIN